MITGPTSSVGTWPGHTIALALPDELAEHLGFDALLGDGLQQEKAAEIQHRHFRLAAGLAIAIADHNIEHPPLVSPCAATGHGTGRAVCCPSSR